LEIAAIEAIMHTQDQMGPVFLQDLQIKMPAKGDRAAVQKTQGLDHGIKYLMHPGRPALNPVVDIYARAVDDGGILQHLLNAHIHIMAVELEGPLHKGLGPGVVSAAGAGCQNKNADFGHG
jgi:hypothetical protein